MEETQPPAVEHLPPFITAPNQTDILFVVTVVLLIAIIPMVMAEVQDVIASGQVRPADGVPPGGACIANVYTDNHHELE